MQLNFCGLMTKNCGSFIDIRHLKQSMNLIGCKYIAFGISWKQTIVIREISEYLVDIVPWEATE